MADGYNSIENNRNVNDLDSSASGDAYIFFSRNDVSVQEEKDDRDCAARAGRFILGYKNAVIVFWLIALLSTGYFATQLLTNTQLAFTPPYSSPAAISHRYFEKVCPVQANISNVLVLAYTNDDSDVRKNDEVKEFSFKLNKTISEEYGDYIWGIESYFLLKQQDDIPDFLYNKFLQHGPDGEVAAN